MTAEWLASDRALLPVHPVCVKPLGLYMAKLFEGERTFLSPLLQPVERGIYRLCGVKPGEEQHWTTYTIAMLAFSVAGFVLALCAAAAAGRRCRFNPQGLAAVGAGSVLQHRGQLRHQHQLAILWRRNHHVLSDADAGPDGAEFRLRRHRHRAGHGADPRLCPAFGARRWAISGSISPAHALCAAAALDCDGACSWSGRACRRIWLPTPTPSAWKASSRSIAQGPVASQEAIKMLGTNGGGFFNVNSAHPFENPTGAQSISWRCGRSSSSARRSPTPSAVW